MNLWPFGKKPGQESQAEIKEVIKDLSNLSNYGDPEMIFKRVHDGARIVTDQVIRDTRNLDSKEKRLPLRWDVNTFEYRPACARIWNFFPNPMGVFAYLGENHFANVKGLNVIRREMAAGGYDLWYAPTATKERIQFVSNFIKYFEVDKLMIEIAIHTKQYGNCWLTVLKNEAGGVLSIEILYPPRLYPIYDKFRIKIIGWEYVLNNGRSIVLPKTMVEQTMTPSIQGKQIGSPALSSLVMAMEADLYSDILNNMVMQRGGMLNAVISLNIPRTDGESPAGHTEDDEDYVERVQSKIDSLFTGSRAGQTIAAMSNVDGVYKMSDIGSLENNYRLSKDMCARLVLMQLGVPPAEAGIYRDQQYVPQMAENQVAAGFDREMRGIGDNAAAFINKHIFEKHLNIFDVRIVPRNRVRGNTLPAAQIVSTLASSGMGPSRNELRDVLGWSLLPPDDPRGNEIINVNAIDRSVDATKIGSVTPITGIESFNEEDIANSGVPGPTDEEQIREELEALAELGAGEEVNYEDRDSNLNQWL